MADAFATAFDEAEKQYNASSFKTAFDEAESQWNLSATKTEPKGDFFKERFKVGALDVPEKPRTTLSELPGAIAEEAKALGGTLLSPVRTLQKGGAAALRLTGAISEQDYADTIRLIEGGVKIADVPKQQTLPGKVAAGATQTAVDFANAFLDPDVVGLMGLGGVPGPVQKAVLTLFAGEMAKAAPQQLQAAIDAAKRRDWQEATRQALGGTGGTILSAVLAGKVVEPAGGIKPMSAETAELIPETDAAMREMGPFKGEFVETGPRAPVESPVVPPARETVIPKVQTELEVPKPELQPATPELKPAEAVRPVEKAPPTTTAQKQLWELSPDEAVQQGVNRGDYYRAVEDAFRNEQITEADYKVRSENDPTKWPSVKPGDDVYVPLWHEAGKVNQVGYGWVEVIDAKGRLGKQSADVEFLDSWNKRHPDRKPITPVRGPENALQERESTPVPVEVPPVSGEAMGAQVREPERPSVPRPEAEREAPEAPTAEVKPAETAPAETGKVTKPKLQKTPEQIRLQNEMDAAWNAIENAKLTWIYDQNASNPAAIRREIRKLPKAKRIIAEHYESLLDEWVKATKRKQEPPEIVGMGGAVKGEITERPKPVAQILSKVAAKDAAKMESKVKLAVEYDIEKLDEQFKIFDEEIGDALTTGGQFLLKKRRPAVAKGAPAEPETVTSKQVNQYFTSKLSTLVTEMRRIRSDLVQQASPEHAEYLDLLTERAQHTFRQVQELRRASHESLAFWNKIKAEMLDIQQALGVVSDLKRRLPILDQLWKDTREGRYSRAGKDFLEFLRVNLFTLGSWTLDFATNLAVAATKLPAFAMGDMVSLMRGNSASRMAAALQAARMSAKNLVPGERFRLPQEIETRLGTVAGGEFQGYGKEVMVDFSEILKGKPDAAEQLKKIDVLLSAPVRMKRSIDNFFGRMGAAAELYHGAYEAAKQAGLKGEDMQTFVENFVRTPPKEAIESAVKEGKEWKFNRDLSEWEEKFAANTITKLAIESFPRWTLQFARYAGEMLALNPTLYRKIKEGRATQQEVIDGLTKAATGWGGVILFNNLVYDNIDADSMEYVKEDGDRVRLSGRTPAPELFFITALLRGDLMKAKAALPQTSIPLAKLLGGEPGGIISPVVDTMRESMRGRYTAERTAGELTKLMNNAIPGKSVLGFIRSLYDPTIREGFGAPIPGVAGLLPQKIEPTTGEPAAPKQKIPGTSFTFPTVGGTPFPGAVRDLNAIQAVLMNHGLAVTRPRRTSIIELPAEDVPKEQRREYERLAGQNVKRIVGEAIVQPAFWESPAEIRRKLLQNWLNAARTEARNAMAEQYGKSAKPVRSQPIRIELLPERFKPIQK